MLANYSKTGLGSNPLPSLRGSGIYHVKNKSAKQANILAQQIGSIIHTTEVVIRDSPGMLTSRKGLGFHTDHHKADWVMWYCHKQTSEGGESILVDGVQAFNNLSANDKKVLETVRLYEHRIFEDEQESHPFITETSSQKKKIYYSFWEREPVSDRARCALNAFAHNLNQSHHHKLTLDPGDILIIDNSNILHARTPITGTHDRHLTRHWISNPTTKLKRD